MKPEEHIESLLKRVEGHSNLALILNFFKSYLDEKREEIKELHRLGAGGLDVASLQAELMDAIIISLFRVFSKIHSNKSIANPPLPPFTKGGRGGINDLVILALGGYGRGELSPYSDIDIMFLYPQKLSPYSRETSENILYILWDLGLDIGHSVRSFKDCIDMAQQDTKVKTSLLEARFLCGKREVYDLFKINVIGKILSRGGTSFISEKLEETRKRHIRYGDSPYLLEPHLKEGEGGLRDIQTAIWISRVKLRIYPGSGTALEEMKTKGIITDKEHHLLQRLYDFLQRIRNELHYLSGRRNDVLGFEFQDSVARFLGHKDSASFTAAERFMRKYHIYTKSVRDISLTIIKRSLKKTRSTPWTFKRIGDDFILSGKEIGLVMTRRDIQSKRNPFVEKPKLLMEAFRLSQMHNAEISERAKEFMRESLYLINNDFRSSGEVRDIFLSLLNSKSNIYDILKTMHDIGILGKYIPEFGSLRVLVLYDLYHKYTVDEHTLLAIKNMEEARDKKYKKLERLSDIFNSLKRPWLLFLALLLHDTGKAVGKGHIRVVGERTATVLKRLRITGDEEERVAFLTKNHLAMSAISERRELSDPKIIESFASLVEDEENLKMLYLLSYADVSAVRPGFWTDWKANLLDELYMRTLYALRGEPFLEDEKERLSHLEKALIEAPDISKDRLETHLNNFTKRYLLVAPAEIVIDHIRMVDKLREERPIVTYMSDHDSGITEFTVLSYDEPGVFSRITGAIASREINIVAGQIFTGKDGIIIDRIKVTNPDEDLSGLEETMEKVVEDIRRVIEGKSTVEDLIPERPVYLKTPYIQNIPTKVIVDNEISDDYTVIEVFCRDRVGLLYQITKTLYKKGVDISSAKINTEAGRVADVFYVTDINKEKITGEEKIREIKDALASMADR